MSHSHTRLCLAFHLAHARFRLQLDEELGTFHGIDLDDFVLLHTLADTEDDTAGIERVAAAVGASRSALLRRVRPLEKIGLVAYHTDVKDRRIVLRRPGLALVKAARDTVERVCARPSLTGELKKLDEMLRESAILDPSRLA